MNTRPLLLPSLATVAVLAPLLLASCSSVYYEAAEKIAGVQKREILVSRVDKAKDAQEQTKVQFASALEEFQSVVRFDGGDLEKKYRTLNAAYERSKGSAALVKTRNDEVDNVAKALFREWDAELRQYTDASLRNASAAQLQETRRRFDQLMIAMRNAEGKIDPVLRTFNDQVLFLKHNLNAQAVGSLQSELRTVEANTAALIREMNASIAEAERFIATMK